MSVFLYHIVYALAFPLALLPLKLLYCFSDIMYFILYHFIRYRRKLVRKNLLNAFPEKKAEAILAIEKSFYHHFCDYFFETIKLLNISDSRMKRHFAFKNEDLLQYFLKEGKPVILLLGHYGNWEWVTSITLWIKADNNTVIGQIYRPLKSKVSDLFFLRLRSCFHSVGFNKYEIYREIVKMRKAGKNWLLGFMSDQKPSADKTQHWVRFLNQDTAVLTGTEKIAKHTHAVVCYLDITCVKRSYYEGKVKLITDNPTEMPDFEITERYMDFMEKTILRNPAGYLWTHNRWKFKKQ
ncbi:MAG: lysophospholipid acyltransferase family protein [Dysgonamonadaceae bacterium]|jgi:KDO2-lipid IV(A) lauroyltransferase|nr:lysophospholipid acyltransferase family protein [Dysgonamonadaceae bacterium]